MYLPRSVLNFSLSGKSVLAAGGPTTSVVVPLVLLDGGAYGSGAPCDFVAVLVALTKEDRSFGGLGGSSSV
jgi:hypothetical protein